MIKVERNNMSQKLTIIDLARGKVLVNSNIEIGEMVDLTNLACAEKPFVISVLQKLRDMKLKGFYFRINNTNHQKVEQYQNNNHCLAHPINWNTRLDDKRLVFELLS